MPAKGKELEFLATGKVGTGSAPTARLDVIGAKPKPKTKPKKTGGKKAATQKNKPREHPHPPVIWACIVEGWVRYHGTKYEKGDTILVQPGKMSESDLNTLQRYFEPRPTEIMAGVSEPIQLLDEGENHVSDSS